MAIRTLPRDPPGEGGKEKHQNLRKHNWVMIRAEFFDFDPVLGLQRSQTKPKVPGTVPTDRNTTIPCESGPTSVGFDNDPELLNCEIAQPNEGSPPIMNSHLGGMGSWWYGVMNS